MVGGAATPFDVSIDLVAADLSGQAPGGAVAVVRAAVAGIPGALVVDVEWCGGAPAGLPSLRVYEPGCGAPRSGEPWDEIAQTIRATIAQVLTPPQTPVMPPGEPPNSH